MNALSLDLLPYHYSKQFHNTRKVSLLEPVFSEKYRMRNVSTELSAIALCHLAAIDMYDGYFLNNVTIVAQYLQDGGVEN
jgi:hypothetical protein